MFAVNHMKVILIDAVHTFISEEGIINDNLFRLLDGYSNKKYILTNAPKEKFKKYCLDNIPYKVFTLEKNPTKTEGGYYEKMLEHFNIKAKDCIYIEHNPKAIKKAEEIGITAMLYSGNIDSVYEFIEKNHNY